MKVLRAVEVREGEAVARLDPSDGIEIAFHIDFADGAIGRQDKVLNLSNGAFVRELSDSRTFCRQADVDAMRANGLALGGTLENAVVVEGDRCCRPAGCAMPTNPCATRCWMPWAIWRWQAGRFWGAIPASGLVMR
jgi:UDP-3-O-[3-hydroxymyristoyl] N-acetylglucosamine deacetylase